jgi:hypothetical protein
MRLRARITGLFRKKPAPPPPTPLNSRAASADEVMARMADVDYDLYGRDPKRDDPKPS